MPPLVLLNIREPQFVLPLEHFTEKIIRTNLKVDNRIQR